MFVDNLTWQDLTRDILNGAWAIGFRAAIEVATTDADLPDVQQTIPYRGTTSHNICFMNPSFVIAASILGLVAVLPAY